MAFHETGPFMEGNPPVTGGSVIGVFPPHRDSNTTFDISFDASLSEQTAKLSVIWDAMNLMWHHSNEYQDHTLHHSKIYLHDSHL